MWTQFMHCESVINYIPILSAYSALLFLSIQLAFLHLHRISSENIDLNCLHLPHIKS